MNYEIFERQSGRSHAVVASDDRIAVSALLTKDPKEMVFEIFNARKLAIENLTDQHWTKSIMSEVNITDEHKSTFKKALDSAHSKDFYESLVGLYSEVKDSP